VVEVRPRDESNSMDQRTAAQTRVTYANGKLVVKTPKPLQAYFGNKSTGVDVTVELPTGSQVSGTTNQGDVRCDGEVGDCALRTYHGDVTVHRAATVKLSTTHGRIVVDRVARDAQVTGSGDLQITEVGGAANVKNLNGPSWIGQVGGDIRVNSAHGDITIHRAGRQVTARTANGNVHLVEVGGGAVVLQTASGDIDVGVRPGVAVWLDVKSSSGRVLSELRPGDAPEDPKESAQIRARTWAGDIVIRRAT